MMASFPLLLMHSVTDIDVGGCKLIHKNTNVLVSYVWVSMELCVDIAVCVLQRT
jgi:hypothetical protein